jgi:peptide/nickel transport system permease protein
MAEESTVRLHRRVADGDGSSVMMRRVQGRWSTLRRLMWQNKSAVVGTVITLTFVLLALLAPMVAPYDPVEQDYRATLQGASLAHPLGTDDLGRDTLSRLVYGTRVSLQVGVVSVGIATIVGVLFGLVAGYWGRWIDDVIMRVMDALFAFPTLMLAIAIIAALGTSLTNAMIAIAVAVVPRFARLVRGEVLSIREREFVLAARSVGVPASRITFRHILPNTLGVVIVQASLSVAFAILTEASLSFLGLGAQPPMPSWGSMLRLGYGFLEYQPWMAIGPGAAITITVLGLTLVGDGIRDIMDPTLRRGY